MILYELHAYRTEHYDRSTEERIRLKDYGMNRSKIEAWIAAYLAKYPDGKVIVSVAEQPRWKRRIKLRQLFTQDANGKRFA